ncbi:MAG TPA: ankyrin repeat domain-containing protein [Fimbriimonadaceae bacterium]|nr:ankyrin repeat domain-containing protein [Fimbriimonadaceae bacterium]
MLALLANSPDSMFPYTRSTKGGGTSAEQATALWIACAKNASKTVSLLLNREAKVDLPTSVAGDTPLWVASRLGHFELCKILIDAGADVNFQGRLGFSPLHAATMFGHVSVCELLLKHGANANAANVDGWTPSFTATLAEPPQRRIAVLDALKEGGADLNKKANRGLSLLAMCLEFRDDETVVWLLENGVLYDDKSQQLGNIKKLAKLYKMKHLLEWFEKRNRAKQ